MVVAHFFCPSESSSTNEYLQSLLPHKYPIGVVNYPSCDRVAISSSGDTKLICIGGNSINSSSNMTPYKFELAFEIFIVDYCGKVYTRSI